MTRGPAFRTAAALAVALVLAGCGVPGSATAPGTDSPTGPSTPGPLASGLPVASDQPGNALAEQLLGRGFETTGPADVTGYNLVAGSHLTVSFDDDGALGANAGCNHMGGTPAWDGHKLTVPELYMTEMGCEQPLMKQEQWLAGLLRDGVAVALTGATLTLTVDGVTLDLLDRRIADPDRPLRGTSWTLEGVTGDIGGSSSFSPVPGGLTVTLRVGADRLDVFNGLTWMSAPLAVGQDLSAATGTVRVAGALSGDAVGCEGGGTDCFADVSVLGSDFDYRITAGSLEVSGTGPTEGRGLTFRTDDPADPPATAGPVAPGDLTEASAERTTPTGEPEGTSPGWQPTAMSR